MLGCVYTCTCVCVHVSSQSFCLVIHPGMMQITVREQHSLAALITNHDNSTEVQLIHNHVDTVAACTMIIVCQVLQMPKRHIQHVLICHCSKQYWLENHFLNTICPPTTHTNEKANLGRYT